MRVVRTHVRLSGLLVETEGQCALLPWTQVAINPKSMGPVDRARARWPWLPGSLPPPVQASSYTLRRLQRRAFVQQIGSGTLNELFVCRRTSRTYVLNFCFIWLACAIACAPVNVMSLIASADVGLHLGVTYWLVVGIVVLGFAVVFGGLALAPLIILSARFLPRARGRPIVAFRAKVSGAEVHFDDGTISDLSWRRFFEVVGLAESATGVAARLGRIFVAVEPRYTWEVLHEAIQITLSGHSAARRRRYSAYRRARFRVTVLACCSALLMVVSLWLLLPPPPDSRIVWFGAVCLLYFCAIGCFALAPPELQRRRRRRLRRALGIGPRRRFRR